MNNIFRYFVLLILINNCSFDTKSRIWTDKEDIKFDKDKATKILIEQAVLDKELNPNLKIKLTSRLIDNSFINNLTNNNGRVNYDGKLKTISKFKFSKIKNFDYYEPDLIFDKDNLIFFDNKGSIIKFDLKSNIIWKKNYYIKEEKKLSPVLTLGQNSETLIVTDNISKYYAIDIKNGDLLWTNYNSSPFNSQIKTYKDKFFVIDLNNVLRCISIKDGKEIWNIKASNTFIKSQKKLSIVVKNDVVYFNNSTGDITAVNINTGNMLWQKPTQKSTIYEDTFLLKSSNIVTNNEMIIFSNNKNEFYSIDRKSGVLKWKQNINSNVQPTIIGDLIFTITNEGFLTIIDSKTGNILKITDIFSSITKKKRKKINPVGFVVTKENIYLTTDNGKLFIIEIKSGKTKSISKIDNNKISRPFIVNKSLFLIKDDAIIKLD